MSGLLCGAGRWPSWECARVPGTKLSGVLDARIFFRYRLDCSTTVFPITSFSACCRIHRACANTVHFEILIAALKSIRTIGSGVRDRSG
jgi:hypothetical protein